MSSAAALALFILISVVFSLLASILYRAGYDAGCADTDRDWERGLDQEGCE